MGFPQFRCCGAVGSECIATATLIIALSPFVANRVPLIWLKLPTLGLIWYATNVRKRMS